MKKTPLTPQQRIEQLEKKLKQSQQELQQEKIKSASLAAMIRIAENRYIVPIKKNFGTKLFEK